MILAKTYQRVLTLRQRATVPFSDLPKQGKVGNMA
jgi:hypothetical protein